MLVDNLYLKPISANTDTVSIILCIPSWEHWDISQCPDGLFGLLWAVNHHVYTPSKFQLLTAVLNVNKPLFNKK